MLNNANLLCRTIKGGGHEDEAENKIINDAALEEYITDLFQPIFLNENMRTLAEKQELAEAIRGGGVGDPSSLHQQQVQRAFLESAMEQNIRIQQQLLAQNEALQTLLQGQGENSPTSPSKIMSTSGNSATFKYSSSSRDGFSNPPPPVSCRNEGRKLRRI
jgi:myosin-15